MNHRFCIRAAFVASAASLAWPAAAQMEIKLGHVLGESHSWHIAASGFAREVAEKTDGRLKINVYPSGQLGSEKDMVEGLQIGSQQAGLIGSGSFQPIEPKLGIVELPYAWPTREHASHRRAPDSLATCAAAALSFDQPPRGDPGEMPVGRHKLPMRSPQASSSDGSCLKTSLGCSQEKGAWVDATRYV
jgi:hypothetical protein